MEALPVPSIPMERTFEGFLGRGWFDCDPEVRTCSAPVTAPVNKRIYINELPLEVLELLGDPDRAPLVLLHEGLGSVGLWRSFPVALHAATNRRVIVFSRFGHGRSAPPRRPRTRAFFHEEALQVLPELLEALDAPEPVLVGHSDGASIALIHAAYRPVSGIVLLAPHVMVEEVTVRAIRKTREAYVYGGLREKMARHHDDPDDAFWGWCNVWLDDQFRSWTLDEEARHVTAPILLIQGIEDPYGSLEQLARIDTRARGPVERLIVLGGHRPHREQPDRVIRAIEAFVSTLPPKNPILPA
jgi:pimeloyl-ACP methyl ester carboxylesterase